MLDFLNTSLFEIVLNSAFVQNSKDPELLTYIICILRTLMIWPVTFILYKVMYNFIYFLDRNKDNRDNLRSSKIKRFCYEDKWREFWEAKDNVHGLAPSLKYECGDCTACDKGNARCKNIKRNERWLRSLYYSYYYLCGVFAFLICNPLVILEYIGFRRGLWVIAVAFILNPAAIIITYKIFNYGMLGNKLIVKAKHTDPYANVYTEMHEDGSYYRYWQTLPDGCKKGSPEAAYTASLNGNYSGRPKVVDNTGDVISRQIERQQVIGAINNSPFWWL